jgi:hypothetical protein
LQSIDSGQKQHNKYLPVGFGCIWVLLANLCA